MTEIKRLGKLKEDGKVVVTFQELIEGTKGMFEALLVTLQSAKNCKVCTTETCHNHCLPAHCKSTSQEYVVFIAEACTLKTSGHHDTLLSIVNLYSGHSKEDTVEG